MQMNRWLGSLVLLLGCACSSSADMSGDPSGAPREASGEESQGGGIQAGTLTAGAWDDNLNFDFYRSYLTRFGQQTGAPAIPRADRVTVQVVNGDGDPVAGAEVRASVGGNAQVTTTTGADGRIYLFPTWDALGASFEISAVLGSASANTTVDASADSITLRLEGVAAEPPQALDVALVIDTTGSMGDELEYLKAEFDSIVSALSRRFPGVTQRWGLVVYRDDGDEYVTRQSNFTLDLTAFKQEFSRHSAGGGGDYPEAPERGLQEAMQLSWRSGATARVLFHVADAPHHRSLPP